MLLLLLLSYQSCSTTIRHLQGAVLLYSNRRRGDLLIEGEWGRRGGLRAESLQFLPNFTLRLKKGNTMLYQPWPVSSPDSLSSLSWSPWISNATPQLKHQGCSILSPTMVRLNIQYKTIFEIAPHFWTTVLARGPQGGCRLQDTHRSLCKKTGRLRQTRRKMTTLFAKKRSSAGKKRLHPDGLEEVGIDSTANSAAVDVVGGVGPSVVGWATHSSKQ